MISSLISLAITAVIIVAFSGCGASRSPAPPTSTAIGAGESYFPPHERKHVPSLQATTLAGPRLSLDDLLGNGVVVVNVWAAWCTECRQESRGLAQLSRELHGVRFVGIDEQDVPANARKFAAAAGADYPEMVDPDGSLLAKLSVLPSTGIPSTLVIDRNGMMAGRIVGAAKPEPLRALIAKVAGGH